MAVRAVLRGCAPRGYRVKPRISSGILSFKPNFPNPRYLHGIRPARMTSSNTAAAIAPAATASLDVRPASAGSTHIADRVTLSAFQVAMSQFPDVRPDEPIGA